VTKSWLVIGKKCAIYRTEDWSLVTNIVRENLIMSICFNNNGTMLGVAGWDQKCAIYRTEDW
jgi:hypothetical protein